MVQWNSNLMMAAARLRAALPKREGFRMANYTYLLRCADGTLYCGWTNDLARRLAAHNAGTASKYTRARRPVELVYAEQSGTKQEAMRREAQIKRLTRLQKEALIASGEKPLY